MARRTYTIEELLSFRETGNANGVLAIAGNPELADIMRKSGSESSDRKLPANRSKDDSSATSDELLFKGTMSRRMGRRLARETSRASDATGTSNNGSVRESIRESTRGSTRESAREPLRDIRELAQETSGQLQWKYHGRSDSEAASTEPVPAPTGIQAQQSEGFQRFYKAVVSPTHVRVTAGGRIVPNTRGPPSPTPKRTNGNHAVENQNNSEKETVGKPPVNPAGLAPQQIPVAAQFVPAYSPPGFQPIPAPVSFVPMAFGTPLPPGLPFAQSTLSPTAPTPLATDSVLRDGYTPKPAADIRRDSYAANDRQDKVTISPPEFFDCTKPYYYNGQFVYPTGSPMASLGNPVVPVQMIGLPYGIMPQLSGHLAQAQPSGSSSTGSGASYAASCHGPAVVPPIVNPPVIPANANVNGRTPPPISSIKPSDITKKQIAWFKGGLKYHEDQLQYNRHQIDEKDMEMKIQTFKEHIQRFESVLKAQLEYEASVLGKSDQGKDDEIPSRDVGTAKENGASTVTTATHESIKPRIPLERHGVNGSTGCGDKTGFYGRLPEPNRDLGLRPRLPNDAALAPIFQPGGYVPAWGNSMYARGESQPVYRSFTTPYTAAPSHSTGNFNTPNAGNSVNGNDAATKNGNGQSNLGVPYLLGTLPKGVNPRTAKDQDYVYSRPLTEEERRARFLYWGKAPKSAVQGLPKFDGKHFYPPSPTKERASGLAEEKAVGRTPNRGRDANRGCRLTESECDPFRPMTPVQRVDAKDMAASEDNCTVLTRTLSFETQVNSGSDEFLPAGGASLGGRENSVDASSVGSVERRSEKSGTKLWQSVLKKGPTSSALSSTTAHGVLPHYAGHAAATLGPSANKNHASSSRDGTPHKFLAGNGMNDGGVPLAATPEKHAETMPANGLGSLGDQLKSLALHSPDRNHLSPVFNI